MVQMKRLILIAAIACCGLPPNYAQNSYDRDTESKLTAIERVVRLQALPSKDVNTLNTFLADEFVLVTMDSTTRSKQDLWAYLQSVDSLRYSMQEMTVRGHGNTAIVTGLFQIWGMQRRKPFKRQGRFVDTWLNREGRWVLLASVSTPTHD
jgi:ketosteroid isomerase-like protein